MRPSVIVLSYNSEETLGATLRRARLVSDEIFVVDSFSRDGSAEVARSMGARVVEHPFEQYGIQRNWAMEHLPITRRWQLHLDADEWMNDELVHGIAALPEDAEADGFLLARYLRFLGRVLRHGGMSPTWHLRLFRSGRGRCEERLYDQHFYLKNGVIAQLPGAMIDDVRMSLTEWTTRHNRWSDAEVLELRRGHELERVRPQLGGNAIERRRAQRRFYESLPVLVRPFGLFVYRYVFRLGFLDGTEGLIFWFLQSCWFRFLVDAKFWERRHVLPASGNPLAPSL